MSKRVLIIGAGGFIGGHIAKESLNRGYETWCGIRQSTSRRYLSDKRINFVEFDYENKDNLLQTLSDTLPKNEKWDYIIYNLGATKCTNFSDFNKINYQYLRLFVESLIESSKKPERFLYISSLSALGSGDEKNYTPISSHDIPQPNTRYGVSKIKAETFIETTSDFPWTIFRPTGVYGPHEQDYLMMIKSIDSHWDFGVGFRKQMLTFIYVEDLVNAMFDVIEASDVVVHKKYIISENRSYTQAEFRRIVAEALGKKWIIPIRLPLWLTYCASFIAEKWGLIRMQPSALNRDKFKIMKQRNWSCDISDAKRDFNFNPRFSLRDGIAHTVKSYLEEKNKVQTGL